MNKIVKAILTSLSLICFMKISYAQVLTQTIRGKVIDQDSKMPLIGANVIIVDSDPFLGASTDLYGKFRIDNVPVGRVSLKIKYIGYEEKNIPNILVGAGKEIVLNIEIIESTIKLGTVEITAKNNKAEVLNDMSIISARTFSVEETRRYAGAIDDPARMVSAFAGVTGNAEGENEIVVRGNSSKGIQWRLEGVEIPNPNHYAEEGATGGPINALNSSMLANSDFLSGAFAPEYGNALSGVFDIKLRNGNNEKKEYSFSAGIMGTDFTLEGPFKKGKPSSYLLNYRYSTLAIISNLGILDYGGIPGYQDMSFKVLFPTKKHGVFSFFGLGGISNIIQKEYDIEDEEKAISKTDVNADLGVIGLNHTYLFGNKTHLKTNITISGNGKEYFEEEINDDNIFHKTESYKTSKLSTRLATTLHNKINAKNKLKTGVIYTYHNYDLSDDEYNEEIQRMETLFNQKGGSSVFQAFTSWKYRINEDLTLISGMHYLLFNLNKTYSVEPRVGLKWKFKTKQSFTGGFGVHSKLEALPTYFTLLALDNGSQVTPNRDIKFSKARHYVLGYDNMMNSNLYLKLEIYYQDLFDIPVENAPNSTYSLINNTYGFTTRALINEGTAANYGLEFTLERFFANNYYYMFTASLYESKYTAMDGQERDARFNGNYAGNFLFGKEFSVGKPEKNKTLSINSKVLLMGGRRYTPIDFEQSVIEERTVIMEDKLYSMKGDDIFQANLAISLRRNKKRTTRELKIEILNITNNAAVLYQYYSSKRKKISEAKQLSLLPVLSYKIEF